MLTAVLLLLASVVLLYMWLKPKLHANFPPGPPSYPVVGSGLFLSKLGSTSTEIFSRLADHYGPITGAFLGGTRAIILNGYEASKEFYSKDEFSSRPVTTFSTYKFGRSLGVFFSNGRLWQEQRRFTLRNLRDFGFGKSTMEGIIQEETEKCVEHIKKCLKEAGPSQVVAINDLFGVSLVNLLWRIIAGKAYDYEDKDFKELLRIMKNAFRSGNISGVIFNLISTYPNLRYLPFFKEKWRVMTSGIEAVYDMLEVTIDEHRKTYDPLNDNRDFIDVYLKALDESKSNPETTFSLEQLTQTCMDLFSAGSESTSNSIAFAILHMIRNPAVQEKVHKELTDIVGKDRFPSWEDRHNLQFTYATISEVFRLSPVSPISVPHLNDVDVNLMGYEIPKGTWAMVNFTTTNMDSEYWENPEAFSPERFLDEDGKFIKAKLDHVLGFGAGKRHCLGEPLARISNFLMFTALIQRFKFEVVPGEDAPSTMPVEGFTVSPQPFSAKVTVRQ